MPNRNRRILKTNDVEWGEARCLTGPGPAGARPQAAAAVSTGPQARIVEQHAEFTVIELSCSCGTATYLKCAHEPQSEDQ